MTSLCMGSAESRKRRTESHCELAHQRGIQAAQDFSLALVFTSFHAPHYVGLNQKGR